MKANFKNMGQWEQTKAAYLLTVATSLGMGLEGYGELAVNQSSGCTYLWLENYPFTLYMPVTCTLSKSDVYVLWTNSEDGEEVKEPLSTFHHLDSIYNWVNILEEGAK